MRPPKFTTLACCACLMLFSGIACHKAMGEPASEYPPVGVIKAAKYQVVLHAGPNGTLYTVKGRDGIVLAKTIDAKQLRAEFPLVFERLKGVWAGNDLGSSRTPLDGHGSIRKP